METVRQLQKRYCSRALTVAIAVWIIFYIASLANIGKGFLLGTLFSIINFILMGQALPLQVMKSKRKTFFISIGSVFFRYIVIAIPIFLAIKMDRFNLYSSVVGIFSVQLIILLDHFMKLPGFARNRQV